MEPTTPKVPREAVQLYNLFIHGDMSRRDFMDGIQKLAVGSLAASAMVEALMPNYAKGQHSLVASRACTRSCKRVSMKCCQARHSNSAPC